MRPSTRNNPIVTLAAALLSLTALAGPARAGGWWNPAWKFRRPLDLRKVEPTGLPGEDMAVAEFPTAGQCRPDGADIRVVSADGREMPVRVLTMGPGDVARIAFGLSGTARRYYVYFGHPRADAPPEPLAIRRGVLMETWKFAGGRFVEHKHAEAAATKAREFLGRKMLDRLFIGHNPFGPEAGVVSRFTGWLVIDEAGEYDFAVSSRNASFLSIDGNVVAANGGAHEPSRRLDPQGRTRLARGLHKIEVLHVSPGGDPVVLAAWKRAGQRHLELMPGRAFARFHRAEPGPLEQYARRFTLDLVPVHAGEAFMENRYYQRFAFLAAISGRKPAKVEWQWDFGDGQTDTRPEINHVYLVPGAYTVKLTARTSSGVVERTQRVFVSRPWDRVTRNRLDSVRDYARLVLEYDFDALRPPEALGEAARLLGRAGATNALLRAGAAFCRRERAPAAVVREVISAYVEALLATDAPERAVAALTRAAEMTDSPAVGARALSRAGRIALRRLDDPNAAEARYARVLERYAHSAGAPALRAARIGLGDVARYRGQYDRAQAAYAAAGVGATPHRGKAEFVKGDFARHVEAYIRERAFDDAETYLDRWAETFPAEKLDGYWSLLRTQYFFHRSLYRQAVREAEVLVKVNPRSTYCPQLLFTAAEAQKRLGQDDAARRTFRRLAEDYPESPLAAEARKRLGGGPR